jgi:hypothetical protein
MRINPGLVLTFSLSLFILVPFIGASSGSQQFGADGGAEISLAPGATPANRTYRN